MFNFYFLVLPYQAVQCIGLNLSTGALELNIKLISQPPQLGTTTGLNSKFP